jgi:predicted phospho-2-dehydro-3-deoxyheptonate aldolase
MKGKMLRLHSIFKGQNRKACIVPIDHGTTLGPIAGLENCASLARQLLDGGADAIVAHKGTLNVLLEQSGLARGTYLLHLSASTNLGQSQSYKVSVASVEEGIRMGAAGISIHVNLGTAQEPEMLREFGRISEACFAWGMPLLAMMYVDGCKGDVKKIAHAARLAQEIGADMVKIDYPGSAEALHQVLLGVQIPVLIAGGAKTDNPADILRAISDAMLGGASGVSIGRNIFQHPNPKLITHMIHLLVREEWTLEECLECINTELLAI